MITLVFLDCDPTALLNLIINANNFYQFRGKKLELALENICYGKGQQTYEKVLSLIGHRVNTNATSVKPCHTPRKMAGIASKLKKIKNIYLYICTITNVGEEGKHLELVLWWEYSTTMKNDLTIFIKVDPVFKFLRLYSMPYQNT